METITINQFAGFKEASIETGSITLMIGPQASGKSIVAKLLFFFREIGYELHGSALAGTSVAQFKEESKKKFCRYFPADSWPQKNFLIIYKSNQEQVRVEYNHCEGKTPEDSISITLSTFYEDSLASFSTRWGALASGIPEGDSQKGEQARNQFQEEVFGAMERALGNWSKFQQFFIPAGRAFYSHLEASVFRALETGQDMDPFLVKFGAFVERSKQVLYERRFFKKGTDKNDSMNAFQKMLATVLSADFKRVKGHDYLQYTSDKRRVRLAQASSGQQEALPMLLVLGRFFSLSHISGRSVYIEEPEAHLFPSTQRKIVEFMASTYRMRQDQMCLVITTHSPYILTAINNLLQAGKIYKSVLKPEASRKLEAIIPSDHALFPGEVKAYSLENGESKSIICAETNLIEADIIDKVSSDISVQFDKLLEHL